MMMYGSCHCKENTGRILWRILLFWITLAGGLWLCADMSFANSPAAARSIVISPDNVPEEAVFLEVLIPMTRDDPFYSSFNRTAGDETGLTIQAPIVEYMDDDGYISYSFHMGQAVSQMRLEKRSPGEGGFYSQGFGDGARAGSQTHLEYIQKNFGTIKAALLDGEGSVLAVSDAASITPGRSGYLAGTIRYDCATGRLTPSIYRGNVVGTVVLVGVLLFFGLISLALRAVFTAGVESAVALAFRIRPWPVILLVNVISNIIFNLLLFLTNAFSLIPYMVYVIVGESLVVAVEYSVYCRLLSSLSRRRLLAYTITANLMSLSLGIGLNYLLPGAGFYGLSHLL